MISDGCRTNLKRIKRDRDWQWEGEESYWKDDGNISKNHVFKVSKYLIIINYLTINASETNTTVKLAYKINNKKT